jgi:lipooligosaccharide transport system permease protein
LTTIRAVQCVWQRYFYVYRKSFGYALVTTFVEPLLYLVAFGFGLGSIVGSIRVDGMEFPYRRFILSGIVAQALLFQGFFEAAYGSFIRMYYQRIFQAIAVTPITLSEVLWAELIWDASKSTFAASAVLLIGVVLGDFRLLGAAAALPLCFVGALLFASVGLWVAAKAKTIEEISYPQYLFVFPMFLFCGVFFPLSGLPVYIQWFARILPLTPIVSLIRALTLGAPFSVWDVPTILVWLAVATPLARRAMSGRLIK